MEEVPEERMELFIQDGVLLIEAPSYYMSHLNLTGTLFLTEYANSNSSKFIEWKPIEIDTVDSDTQEEWAVVNTVKNYAGTNAPSKSKYIKISFGELSSFKVSRKNDRMTFYSGVGEIICSFFFQHGNCQHLLHTLKQLILTAPVRRDKNHYLCMGESKETKQLGKSFATLDLFNEPDSHYNGIWNVVNNTIKSAQPYETAFIAFSKIANIVTVSPQERPIDENAEEILSRSITALEKSVNPPTAEEYEVLQPELPDRQDYPRGLPLTADQWKNFQDSEGRIEDVDFTKLHIFRGGIAPEIRTEVWKFLLGYYPWITTRQERQLLCQQRQHEYYVIKLQWTSLSKVQEENFSDFRERKSLIEKDVNRTDRNMPFYSGDRNPNLKKLYEILMSYVMYNFDLGYVQGMNDLLSPILHLFQDDSISFWCFVGFMDKVSCNFDMDQAGMKLQLDNLRMIVLFVSPKLGNYLQKHESSNMFFCFRWLLVWFKRELSEPDVMRLWEVLWTGLPCRNFHLLICVAILDMEKDTLMENNFGFTEILKHINELSGHLNIDLLLNRAEGIYNQIRDAEQKSELAHTVRTILGLPVNSPNNSTSDSIEGPCSIETLNITDTEIGFDQAISSNYLRKKEASRLRFEQLKCNY